MGPRGDPDTNILTHGTCFHRSARLLSLHSGVLGQRCFHAFPAVKPSRRPGHYPESRPWSGRRLLAVVAPSKEKRPRRASRDQDFWLFGARTAKNKGATMTEEVRASVMAVWKALKSSVLENFVDRIRRSSNKSNRAER